MDEARLQMVISRAMNDDAEALGELYQFFRSRVFGLCRHLLGRQEDAEDATSEVFTRLPKSIKSYEASLPFPRWLLSVTSHHCVDRLRRRQLEQRLFEVEPVETLSLPVREASPLQQVIDDESRDKVKKAIAALPQLYRVPLTLRYYSELSYDEIAQQLGLGRANVATLIFRAKQQLRRALSETA
ncbi:MAG TPA: sigma-70 family RNA polymerase sigma factor [Terriglobia bacterium]